jgi:ABC-type nitrate/sulfonate/bicarbonate transport system permease component
VIFPGATPSIVTGIRIATTASLILAIGAGLIGGAPGLGQLLFVYQNNGDGATVFGLIILVGILGLIINVVLGIVERKAVPWSSRAEVVA